MRGVILAGGKGTRLYPLTRVTNKHLLPVHDRPMIYYPVETLRKAGITDALIITGPESAGDFLKLLGSGVDFGMNFTYRIQDEAGGIAQALGMAEDFVLGGGDGGDGNCMVVLGDNIIEDDVSGEVGKFRDGAMIFLKEVHDPERFGVAKFGSQGKLIAEILEKPKQPPSRFAVTGLYVYDREVFPIIRGMKPSGRGELEITDVNNAYLRKGKLSHSILRGFWSDAGTFESLFNATKLVSESRKKK
ncbi:NTP transferase domain-containing protein [Candidatus Micrarchaeota archaeon]|nr:NTP transferase domain-containing protein [Candidatus Micrarchaeota archaeon]